MHSLQIGPKHYQVPATWNELTRQQLLAALPLVYRGSAQEHRLALLAVLLGEHLLQVATIHPVQLAQLLVLTEFFFAETERLTAQLQPYLDLAVGRRYHAPRTSLRNVLFGEFVFADTFFVLYVRFQRPEHLDQFLATLYRPRRRGASPSRADWTGDMREAFNEHLLEHRAPLFAPVPLVQKLAVLTWYRGCRAELAEEFPEVFDAAEAERDGEPSVTPRWDRVLRKLSGGAFGTLQQTAGQHLRTILAEMQDAARDYQKMKRQTKKR